MNDDIEALRTELSRLAGPARTHPLARLGQVLMNRYWRAGPGTPAALPHLDSAIEALDEAYGHLDPTDHMRGALAGQLGWLLAARYTAHGGPERDRETGIVLIEEALAVPDLPSTARIFRLTLGQLYAFRTFRSGQVPTMFRPGSTPTNTADVDRAADCFRQFLAGPPISAETTALAQTMLTVVEAMQAMLGGFGPGVAGFDLGKMTAATAAMQSLQQLIGSLAAGGDGMPAMPWLFNPGALAALDPVDRPVPLLRGMEPEAPVRPAAARPAAVRTDLDAVRRLLRDQLALAGGSEDPYLAIEAILRPEAPPLAVHVVDELVGLAATVVDQDGAEGIDALLLALALYLRGRRGHGGEPDDDDLASDAGAATEQLLAAAATLPTDEPRAVAVVLRLAALLGAEAVPDRVADRYADVARAVGAVGAGGLALPQPDGLLLLDAATGRLASAHPGAPLPDRLLVAGDGPAEAGDSVVSYVASGGQVTALARRGRLPLTADPVFVANPRGDLEAASIAAMVLRRTFYPRSTGLGRTIEHVDGAGAPDEVLAHLDASLLHLDCAVTAGGALQLAGPAELAPGQIAAAGTGRAAGGLAVLPRGCHGFVALADAFIAAGFTGVIGWLWPVPEPVIAPALLVLHAKLVDDGLAPAEAVHEVRRWMRDRDRKPLPDLPAGYATPPDRIDLADPAHWTALVHRGS